MFLLYGHLMLYEILDILECKIDLHLILLSFFWNLSLFIQPPVIKSLFFGAVYHEFIKMIRSCPLSNILSNLLISIREICNNLILKRFFISYSLFDVVSLLASFMSKFCLFCFYYLHFFSFY